MGAVRQYIGAKLHGLRITRCDVNYHGSITLDQNWLDQVGMKPYEQVHVLNCSNGHRLVTYILPGERGKKQCELNGAAALLADLDDTVLVLTYVSGEEFQGAKVIMFDEKNNPIDEIEYESS